MLSTNAFLYITVVVFFPFKPSKYHVFTAIFEQDKSASFQYSVGQKSFSNSFNNDKKINSPREKSTFQ